jgi:hypothetical protein
MHALFDLAFFVRVLQVSCRTLINESINNDGNRDIDFDTLPSLETTSIGSIDHLNNDMNFMIIIL